MGAGVGDGESSNPFETSTEVMLKKCLESIYSLTSHAGDPSELIAAIRVHAAFGLGKAKLVG